MTSSTIQKGMISRPVNLAVEAVGPLGDPAYTRVCRRLRQEILAGVFDWGARLKISDLAKRYSISQMPVREALQQLQGEGLVTIEPNKGARVRKVDERFVGNMYDIRGAIDAMLIRLATPHVTEADLRALDIILGTHDEAERRGDLAASLEYNKQFHRVIHQSAGNRDAMEIIERYWDLIDALRRQYGFSPGYMVKVIDGHRQLLETLRQGDADAAERLAKQHCERSKGDLIEQMRIRNAEH